jgi:hypothetical protein
MKGLAPDDLQHSCAFNLPRICPLRVIRANDARNCISFRLLSSCCRDRVDGGLPWMQAVFYRVRATVFAIIAISSYKLTKKTVGADR